MKNILIKGGVSAIVDDEDYEWILDIGRWYVLRNGYATICIKNTRIYMHRLILEKNNFLNKNKEVDHINGNKLDNRKENLRCVTSSENKMNTKAFGFSKYKGVSLHKQSKKWQARIQKNKKSYWIGIFNTEKEAAIVYDKKAKELFGEFAKLNFE